MTDPVKIYKEHYDRSDKDSVVLCRTVNICVLTALFGLFAGAWFVRRNYEAVGMRRQGTVALVVGAVLSVVEKLVVFTTPWPGWIWDAKLVVMALINVPLIWIAVSSLQGKVLFFHGMNLRRACPLPRMAGEAIAALAVELLVLMAIIQIVNLWSPFLLRIYL